MDLLDIIKFLGVPSLTGLLGLYIAWISFPPELVIEAIADKSKTFSSESRIKIMNNGKLPALDINAHAGELYATVAGNILEGCSVVSSGSSALKRLSGGESTEISISPGIAFSDATQLTEFSYVLSLTYSGRLFFFSKKFSKQWKVQLRNFPDGFAWHTMPA